MEREGCSGDIGMTAPLLQAGRLNGVQIPLGESKCIVHILTIAEIACRAIGKKHLIFGCTPLTYRLFWPMLPPMVAHDTYTIDWKRHAWAEDDWVPVPMRGFRLEFEMAPNGCVRRTAENGTKYWQLPMDELGDGRGWGYRLACCGRTVDLQGGAIFRAFGVFPPDGAAEYARIRAGRENRAVRRRVMQADPLCRLMLEGECGELDKLRDTLDKGCPWERGRMVGDARGADPVLGF